MSPLALVLAVVVLASTAWLLAKVPPFLPPWKGVGPIDEAAADEVRVEQYLRWFAHMRWIVALLALLVVIVTIELGFVPRAMLVPLFFTVVAVGSSNLVYSAIDRRRLLGRRKIVFVELSVDLALLIVLLHLSGGIDSPLYLLPVFNVLLAGIVLTRRQCFMLAWAGGLVCAVGVGAEWARFIPHLALMSHGGEDAAHGGYGATYVAARAVFQLGLMVLTAHFVSRLAGQTWTYERGLAVTAEEARAGRELLERALENTGVGVRVVDERVQPLFVSEQWGRFFPPGGDEEKAALREAEAAGSALRRTLERSSVERSELPIAVPGSGERTFAVTTAPLHDPSGRTVRAVELVQEVTTEKEGQRRLLKASQLAAVGEIAGKLAHEINNPTAIISAKGRLLLSDRQAEMSPKVNREVERIVALADRVASIAKGLLAYGRPSVAPHQPIDPALAVRSALSLVEDQASRQNVTIVDQLGELRGVSGSTPELEQTFLNLFLNALDAMPSGGSLTVSSRAARPLGASGEAIEIVVADTGHGIPAEVREHVFEPFFTTKEEGRGSGLGLAICQGIVRSHGGEIELESEPGCGTRFAVRLPVIPAEVHA